MDKARFFALVLGVSLASAANAWQTQAINMSPTSLINNQQSLVLQQDSKSSLTLAKEVTLKNGKTKARFQQTYQGVPVWGVVVTADKKQGRYQQFTGQVVTGLKQELKSFKPTLTELEAVQAMLAKKGMLTGHKASHQSAKLYVRALPHENVRLVYLVEAMFDGKKPTRPMAFVDAHSGEVIHTWEGLTTNKQASGPGGNQKTGRYEYGRDFASMEVTSDCYMRTNNVDTVNLNHQTSGGNLFRISNCTSQPYNDYKQINGAYSPINDAHYFGNVVFNMYSDWYQSAPLSFKLVMRVHYSSNYENAFWDGRQMTFGDGANYFYPLVSLDVVSHEVSHGFTQQNSDLIYENQSGGINEAFSDMAGEAAKYYMSGGSNNWLVGEQIFKGPSGQAMRYFEDPTRDGRSIGHASDYYDGIDVHFSSGVFNRTFFLLANKANWNTEKAFDVFVLANEVYWSPNATFMTAACGVKRAARDLDYNVNDVVSAFDTVGVDGSCGEDPDPGPGPNPNPGPTPHPEARMLANGVNVMVSGVKDSETFYYLDVPQGARYLRLETEGGSGDADLFVAYDKSPTRESFVCRSQNDGNSESCDFLEPMPGRYYVMLLGYSSYSGATLHPMYFMR